jgi:hypothetical protein
MIVISPTSPVLVWVISLLRAASIREQAQAQSAATRRLDVDTLSDAEVKAWAVAASRSRGPS